MAIYLPQDPWQQMMPQLVGQMATAKYKQSLEEPEQQPKLYPGASQYYRYDKNQRKLVPVGGTVKGPRQDMSVPALTSRALQGDQSSQAILDRMAQDKIVANKAAQKATVEARLNAVDISGVAESIIQGRETIENVKNTFGIPVQEAVRKEVLAKEPGYNFLLPRSAFKALSSSLRTQEKSRGLMGSFVRNLNKQLDRVDVIAKDVGRLDVRFLDLPKRELLTRAKGSGKEKAFEAYLIEISNEIAKLSTGSAASIRELSTDAQERWAKIHDPNLSLNELKIILNETRQMANMRITSTDEELQFTRDRIRNIRGRGPRTRVQERPEKIEVERRQTPDGQIIIKFSDETYAYE